MFMPAITHANAHKQNIYSLEEGRFGAVAQWYNTCLTCMRPHVQSLALYKKKKGGRLEEWAQRLRTWTVLAEYPGSIPT